MQNRHLSVLRAPECPEIGHLQKVKIFSKKVLTLRYAGDIILFADAVQNKKQKAPQSLEKQEKNLDN